ncbi:protein-disulfide reductase DsbD [Noviherbaspirillum sp.]|uniref:protein-disulfide reductase DsbD n=1 Tax=Noviherbaspirillum sp. TaxID=1926288 RepID=UPI0025E104AC|nr:protein-disulfide reductase DsbD [Noviherbaspirillum sp.]
MRRASNFLVLLALLLILPMLARAVDDFLAPEAAFKLAARMVDDNTAELNYVIADGYYMYRDRFAFNASDARIGAPVIPPGKIKFDETFQKDVETYRHQVTIRIPVEAVDGAFTLKVTGQGCADAGLCYPPMESSVRLAASGSTTDGLAKAAAAGTTDTESGRISASLKEGKLLVIVPLFVLLGLGLAFTPCVLPMVPILSSIIVGEGVRSSRGRGVLLSAIYSLGMALVYTLLGVAAGLAGEGLSAALQNAWVLGAFALVMAALSLSMFGFYQLEMPPAIQARLMRASDRQTAGKLAGVFVMGALSALIVGPCVAAPLAGTLVFISRTRDVLVGGGALFSMALGMSIPLLLVGASAGTLLPRAGAWMETIKKLFGVLMLATALWMVSPVIPVAVQMLGWAALCIGYAIYLIMSGNGGWVARAAALVLGGMGLLQLAGAASGGYDVLAPLAHLAGRPSQHKEFKKVRSLEELAAALDSAQGKTVMLDFYADWCVSCKEMERFTFTDTRVQSRFGDMVLLQADVTANSGDDKALLKRFGLFGPPGIIFFGPNGREVADARVIGYQNTEKFLQSLSRARQM